MSAPTETERMPATTLTNEQMQDYFEGGPSVTNAVLALVGDQIYRRENCVWRWLASRTNGHKETTDGP